MGFEFCPVSFFADRELPEHGEIDDPALGLRSKVVGPLVVVQQEECFFERGGDVIDLVLGRVGPVLNLGAFLSDAGLFGLEHLLGDAVAVVELDELLLLGGQVAQATGVTLALGPGDVGSFLNERTEAAPDQVALFEREPWFGVFEIDLVFQQSQPDVAGAAGPVGRDAAQAGVVLVVDALLAAVAAVAVAFTAATADDLAGQVVVVLAAAAAAGAVAVEGDLGSVERLLGNQRIVAATNFDVAVGDDADVVVVTQHAVDSRQVERLGRAGRRGARTETGVVEDLGDRADGVQTGRGEVEGEPDQSGAFRVDGDARDLTVLDRLADVQVAKAGGAERAAFEVLALHAEADLLAVVARAEGVDAAHDGVVEHALGAGINVFLGRFELAAERRDLAQQPEGVELVPSNAG